MQFATNCFANFSVKNHNSHGKLACCQTVNKLITSVVNRFETAFDENFRASLTL